MTPEKRIEQLDALRGIAIIAVFMFHFYMRWPAIFPYGDAYNFRWLRPIGAYGVNLFFMISGFVIFMTLERSKSFGSFMYRRWIRLFPAMLVISLLIFFSADFFDERPAGNPKITDLLPGILFVEPAWISALLQSPIDGIEGAFWSLYVEMRFYLLFGAAYFLLGRRRATWLLLSISSIAFIFQITVVILTWKFSDNIAYNILAQTLNTRQLSWFLLGILAYQDKIKDDLEKSDKWFRRLFFFGVIAPLIMYHRRELWFAILTVALFWFAIYKDQYTHIFQRKWLKFFGFISYPFYLIHENLGVSMIVKAGQMLPELPLFLLPLFPVVLISIFSYLMVVAIEAPTRKFLTRFSP